MRLNPRLTFIGANLLLFIVVVISVQDDLILRAIPRLKANPPRIGEVKQVQGEARKRSPPDLIWTPVKDGDTVYDDEVYYTGPTSSVELDLKKDTTLSIHSESVVGLGDFSNRRTVYLDEGEIEATADSPNEAPIRVQSGANDVVAKLSSSPQKFSRGRGSATFKQKIENTSAGASQAGSPNDENSGDPNTESQKVDLQSDAQKEAPAITYESAKEFFTRPWVLLLVLVYLCLLAWSFYQEFKSKTEE